MDQTATLAENQPKTEAAKQEVDIFAWANNLFLYKDQLKTEIFLLGKTGVVYKTKHSDNLSRQMQALLVDGLLEFIITGAGQGLVVRGFEEAEGEENVLQKTMVNRVDKLVDAMNWLGAGEAQVELFNEEEHDLKRMKGIIARCTHPDMPQPFYVIKALSQAQVLKGLGAWSVSGNKFEAMDNGAALRIPADNQLLVVQDELYVFNQSKLERLFGYNAKKNAIAAKKVAQIEANFSLSFADELDLQTMVKDSKTTINKMQKIDPNSVKQDQLLDHAEEMGVELMTDETGAIIIMNNSDLTKFVNLLNDDYVESSLTGLRYEIKSKKLLQPNEE